VIHSISIKYLKIEIAIERQGNKIFENKRVFALTNDADRWAAMKESEGFDHTGEKVDGAGICGRLVVKLA
jgi:midasin (ATPase involved in ribosome maturation)